MVFLVFHTWRITVSKVVGITPILKVMFMAIWKGSHNPILTSRGLKLTMLIKLLTTYVRPGSPSSKYLEVEITFRFFSKKITHLCYLRSFQKEKIPSLKLTAKDPENQWFEEEFPFGMTHFQGRTVSFRECKIGPEPTQLKINSPPGRL